MSEKLISYPNIETQKQKENKEKHTLSKTELIIFGLKQKGITYRALKLKLKELKEKEKMLLIAPNDEEI